MVNGSASKADGFGRASSSLVSVGFLFLFLSLRTILHHIINQNLPLPHSDTQGSYGRIRNNYLIYEGPPLTLELCRTLVVLRRGRLGLADSKAGED